MVVRYVNGKSNTNGWFNVEDIMSIPTMLNKARFSALVQEERLALTA